MRALDPDRLPFWVGALVDEQPRLAERRERLGIELLQPQRGMAFIFGLARRRAVVNDPCGAVVVEEQRRIDALHVRQEHRVGPWPLRPLGRDHEIAAAAYAGVED